MTRFSTLFGAAALSLLSTTALAETYNISVWAGGSNDNDSYRLEAIEMAADILEREYAIAGEKIEIIVEGKRDFGRWAEFKQADLADVLRLVEEKDMPDLVNLHYPFEFKRYLRRLNATEETL